MPITTHNCQHPCIISITPVPVFVSVPTPIHGNFFIPRIVRTYAHTYVLAKVPILILHRTTGIVCFAGFFTLTVYLVS